MTEIRRSSTRRAEALAGLAALLATALTLNAAAQPQAVQAPGPGQVGTVGIGVMVDMNGPSASSEGQGAVVAAQMAAEDAGGDLDVRILPGDHAGKPDVGAAIAGRWFDVEGVDAIADMQGSPIGFAVQAMAAQRHKILLLSGSTSSDFSGRACSPLTVQWTVDTFGIALTAARAITAAGGRKWFFLTVDQAFGYALTRDTAEQVARNGGRVLGNTRFPAGTTDFASQLLQASTAGADVIAVASVGADTANIMKQAAEFGLNRTARIAPLLSTLPDIRAAGPEVAQGAYEVAPFYWDRTPETRAWAERFHARTRAMPTGFQAGTYSSVLHYLRAVRAVGTKEAAMVMHEMEARHVHDMFADDGVIRPDRRMVHDMYLLQVRKPGESRTGWDLYDVVQTLPGESVTRPLAESECPLVPRR